MQAGIELPVSVVPGSNPPRIRWVAKVAGKTGVPCEGYLQVSLQTALVELIAIVDRLLAENRKLKGDE
jgi:hypothetical protein